MLQKYPADIRPKNTTHIIVWHLWQLRFLLANVVPWMMYMWELFSVAPCINYPEMLEKYIVKIFIDLCKGIVFYKLYYTIFELIIFIVMYQFDSWFYETVIILKKKKANYNKYKTLPKSIFYFILTKRDNFIASPFYWKAWKTQFV